MPFLTTALVAGGISAAAGLGGAAIASHGAGQAAKTQSDAALNAAQLQHQDAQAALGFQEKQYDTSQKEFSPWLQSGQSALSNLNYLLGIGPNGAPSSSGAPGVPATMSGTNPTTGTILPPTAPRPSAPVLTNPGARVQPGGNILNPPGNDMPLGGRTNSGVPVSPSVAAQPGAPGALTPGAVSGPPPTGIQPGSSALVNPSLGAYGSLSKGWDQTFTPPSNLTESNDPGYNARLNLGETALNNSAAARGGLLTGGTARDVNQFAQDYASNEYGNVYNHALNTYGTNYNTFEANQANQYNRLASLAGIGQQTASQLAVGGQNTANNISNTLLTSGAQQGQQLNNAAAATASGYVGGANAYSGALSGIGGNLSNLASLYSLLNQGGGSNPTTGGV